MSATKREQLEKLIPEMKAFASALDAKTEKNEVIEQAEYDQLLTMAKDVKNLKAEILTEAKNAADVVSAGVALEEAKGFLADLGMNPDAKTNAEKSVKSGIVTGTVAEQLVGSAAFKSFLSRFPDGHIPDRAAISMDPIAVKHRVKALITGVSDTSGGALIASDASGIFDMSTFGQRPLTLRDIITVGTTGSDTVEYARMTGFTNAAAPVPEATTSEVVDGTTVTTVLGGVKPESALALEKVIAVVKTIAHWMPVTRRALADAGQLRTLIDNFLIYGLNEELEDQMLTGDGTGENLPGIATTAGIQTHALGADTVLDAYRKAKTKVRLGGRGSASAYVMHPNDWEQVDLLRNLDGNYYFGGPMNEGQPRLWGLPVVETEGVPEGTAYVADWRQVVLWDREQTTVTVSDQHADFFTRNLLAILAEMRVAFGVIRPAAIVKITGV